MESIKTVQTKNLIADMLKNEILCGIIKDGEELTQEQLAEKLEVSRMPVREALQLLEQDGFVTRLPNRHVIVNGIDKRTFLRNVRILSSVEKEIAAMISEEDKDTAKLEEALILYKSSVGGSKDDVIYHLINFHKHFSRCLEDEYTKNTHSKLVEGFFSYAVSKYQINFEYAAKKAENILINIKEKNMERLQQSIDEYYCLILDAIEEEK